MDVKPLGRRLSVLIVDPHVDAAESFATLLRLKGYFATTARDGPSAVAAVMVSEPDVVFMELVHSGENGYQIATRLRRTFLCRPAFVAVTVQRDIVGRSVSEGFDRHLLKPAEPEEIFAILREIGCCKRVVPFAEKENDLARAGDPKGAVTCTS
jgi:CheY-like chemotaxis protein